MIPLQIYDQALSLCTEVYKLTRKKELVYDRPLVLQLRRAAVSVPSNISEGYLRSKKVFNNHLFIAVGSSNELQTLLEVVEHVYDISTQSLKQEYDILSKRITALRKRLPNSNQL